ncbi:MAG: hypothetical protein A3E38_01585 [Candidatus Moranbacteria bacterium RIFCSPHIGHO2_12_FULL_54_9]|nr:MAG: hypothetical protein A2878_02200 [Candidatus Moranbacteria bacterium RIFCSPHIGHO2_01_FULL_54_31]OGI25916.1 MAG: hypothetical protein A3E38_01585 [Candidatus Moranbacteria bacterium RIFCSPHIGHO2_12_FULL_54_9]
MVTALLKSLDPIAIFCFRLHDFASDIFAKHLFLIKRSLLIVAHLSLFGFLLPDLRTDFGQMAANVLIFILFLSPLSRIFRMRLLLQMMSIRRELGILMAYMATVHGLGYLLDPAWFAIYVGPYWRTDFFAIEPRFLFGMLAYALTLPLFLTSNNLAMRFLGGAKWKLLHRIVYAVFVAAIFHRFLIRGVRVSDNISGLIQAILLIAAYAFAKLLAWKNFLPPLREAIAYIAGRYRRFEIHI